MNNTNEYLLRLIQKRNNIELSFKTIINNYNLLINENINFETKTNKLNKMYNDNQSGWFFNTTIIDNFY